MKYFFPALPHPYVFWAHRFLEVKDWIIVTECPKISNVQCIWGRIFESLENIFVF